MNKTPKFRFKEFSGDWEVKKLGEMGEFKKTYAFSRSVEGPGEYKHIHYGDVHMNYKGIISKDKFIPSIDIPSDNKYEVIKEKDIIFADASEDRKDLGKVAVVRTIEGNVLSGLHTFCFRPKKDLNSEFFLGHSLNKEYLKFMYTRGNGAKVLGISKSNLSQYKFLVPTVEEQEKIASFFSLIDDKISLQDEKVEALKDYKNGMMQKIFSRELRFKYDDGRDYPDWKHKKLNSIVERVTRKNKGIQSTLPLTISAQYGLVDQITFFNKTVASSNLEGYYLLEKGEFAYNKSYSTGYPFGAIKRLDNYDKGVLSSLYICFSPLKNMDSDFLLQYFETSCWHKEISMIAVEGARNHGLLNISVSDFFETYHWIPCYDEQVKIGRFLRDLDNKLNKEQEKLDSLNQYKKGLLQQMFV